jgi:ubiquinone/menaquinone biosynthesis C-methylase UbiE
VDARVHRRVQRYGWDLAVEDYGRYWVPVLRECSERALALAAPVAGDRVLDVATGTGVAAFLAAELVGPSGSVLATDISEKMVESVRTEAARWGMAHVSTERVDAEDLPYDDGSFDVAVCVLGMMYPADPQRAIDQMYRVLRPGGRAAVCVWGRRDACGWNAVFPIVDARVASEVCPMFYALGNPGALAYAYERAGFIDAREERVTRSLDWPGDEAALGAIFAGGPVALAYSKFDDRTRADVHAEYLESIAPYRRADGGYDVPGEFVLMVGTKG